MATRVRRPGEVFRDRVLFDPDAKPAFMSADSAPAPAPRYDVEALAATVGDLVRAGTAFHWFGGPKQRSFEEQFARFAGARYGVMTNSGTSALRAMLMLCGVRPGTVVALPVFAYHVVLSTVIGMGATPFLLRVDEDTLSLDCSEAIRETPRDAVLLVVHAAGRSVDVQLLAESRPDLRIVEDCSDAQTSTFNGSPVGLVGIAASWSFTTDHNVVHTASAAGMVTTNDSAIAERVRRIVHYGKDDRSVNPGCGLNPMPNEPGINGMTSELEACFGLATLESAGDGWSERRTLGELLSRGLSEAGIHTVADPMGSKQNHYDVLFRLDATWARFEAEAMAITHTLGAPVWTYHFSTSLPWAEKELIRSGSWSSREVALQKENNRLGPVFAISPPSSEVACATITQMITRVFLDDVD